MGENTKIEWCDHTFNPWRGCTKVAAGCANCYADRQARRSPGTLGIWGDDGTRVLASESMWREPIKWNKAAVSDQINHEDETHLGKDLGAYIRPRVFCASMADVFEDWAGQMSWADGSPVINRFSEQPYRLGDARAELFKLIDATPNLDWLLLTKRPENIRRMWPCANDNDGDGDCWVCAKGGVSCKQRRSNVWLGTSVATQEDADKNIPELLKCRDLSPVLFVSAEPLLDAVDLTGVQAPRELQFSFMGWLRFDALKPNGERYYDSDGHIDWVICGGESGPKARPMHPDWARSLRDQCQVAGVPFFFKQWGEWGAVMHPLGGAADQAINAPIDGPFGHCRYGEWHGEGRFILGCLCGAGHGTVAMVGKKHAGRILDGREWNEFPRVEGGDA